METDNTTHKSAKKKSATQLSCELCDYEATRRDNYLRHMKQIHNKQVDNTYPCSCCDYVCVDIKTFMRHKHMHTSEKPYECYFCDKNFRRHSHMMVHERRHTRSNSERLKKKVHECKFCNYRCSDTVQLAKHERMHALENPFKCKYCPFACDQLSALTFHEKEKHEEFQEKCLEKFPEKFSGNRCHQASLECFKKTDQGQSQGKEVLDQTFNKVGLGQVHKSEDQDQSCQGKVFEKKRFTKKIQKQFQEIHGQFHKKEDHRKLHASEDHPSLKQKETSIQNVAYFSIQHKLSDFIFHQQNAVKNQQK